MARSKSVGGWDVSKRSEMRSSTRRGHARSWTRCSPARYLAAVSCSSLCALVLGGCRTPTPINAPPCPRPSPAAINETAAIITAPGYEHLEHYLGEVERYCNALEELRK